MSCIAQSKVKSTSTKHNLTATKNNYPLSKNRNKFHKNKADNHKQSTRQTKREVQPITSRLPKWRGNNGLWKVCAIYPQK